MNILLNQQNGRGCPLQNVNDLRSELDYCRKKSDTLQKINTLHQKIAEVLDLTTMLETYSIWSMEHIPHSLVGYNNIHNQRMHMYCSCHGPQRKTAIRLGEDILSPDKKTTSFIQRNNLNAFSWSFPGNVHDEKFVIIREEAPFSSDEASFLKTSFATIAPSLKRTLEFEKVFSQARTDTLTGLPNRLVFEERIDTIIDQAKRYKHPLTLAALDLDRFKSINDYLGHHKGDEVLTSVSAALKQQIRQADLFVRMGGDEFLLILPDTDLHHAELLARRLCSAVAALNISTPAGDLGVSVGLMQWQEGLDKQKWLETADDILYKAKSKGLGYASFPLKSGE
ncbi:MAG: GGDEF domain-containing protein [Desulfobulbus propionicus]|nr:MAG: GGDEF domain-containing protein [Desulfobulbus propionicus]